MSGHSRVPDWHYGDVLAYNSPSSVAHLKAKAMFIAWESVTEFPDPNESVALLLSLNHGEWTDEDMKVWSCYCGWYVDDPA